MPCLIDYFRLQNVPNVTDKSFVSNSNILFLKCLNYSLAILLLWAVSPEPKTHQALFWVNFVGSTIFGFVGVLNVLALCVVWPKRPTTRFRPFPIILATFSTPILILADLFSETTASIVNPQRILINRNPIQLAILFTGVHRYLKPSLPHFEYFYYLEIWCLFFVFLVRKIGWLRLNLQEKDKIVEYFSTTCWERISKHPRAEFVYCATTGQSNIMATQLGKFIVHLSVSLLFGVNVSLGPQGAFQCFFVAYLMGGALKLFVKHRARLHSEKSGSKFANPWVLQSNAWYYKHHKFHHCVGAQYLTKHFEHHDVVPLASIGGTGFQETVHRGLTWQYHNFFGNTGNFYRFFIAVANDEWAHNYCPTASHSGVINFKPPHLEHHMNRTLPFGLITEFEIKENGYKYDESIWDNIKNAVPGIHISIPNSTWEEHK